MTARTRTRWTPALDARLRELYPVLGLAAARILGVTWSAVKNRVRTLGLRRPARRWTAGEDATLRAAATRGESLAVAAHRLGRGVPATYRRAAKLGIVSGRHWTPEEVETVRRDYRLTGCAALAAKLLGEDTPVNRHAVYALASKLGVTVLVRHPAWVYGRVRELYARGFRDGAIARAMADYFPGRHDRERVTAIRRRLGLPAIRQSHEERIAMGRKGRLAQMATGVNPRDAAFAKFARSYGLPEDTPPRAVEIVLALLPGPKTKAELEACGCKPGLTWNAIPTTYISGLVRRGLVARIKLGTPRGSRERYTLTAAALNLLADSHPEIERMS